MIQFYVQIVLEFMNCHFRNDNVAIKVSNYIRAESSNFLREEFSNFNSFSTFIEKHF